MSVMEAISTMEGKRKKRAGIVEDLKGQVSQLKRSKDLRRLESIEAALGVLETLNNDEALAIQQAVSRVLSCSRTLPLTPEVMRSAISAQQIRQIEVPDSIIFASIHLDLRYVGPSVQSCFVSTDSKLVTEILEDFADQNCKCFANFGEAQKFLQAALSN